MKKDNSTQLRKATLRREMLKHIVEPVICETHGGEGVLYQALYSTATTGVVFETKESRAIILARQRPMWRVYQADCAEALCAGVAADLAINFLDCDPYGEPWSVLDGFFVSERERPSLLAVVVNDGLRQKLQTNSGYDVASMKAWYRKHGSEWLYDHYLEICQEKLEGLAAQQGYTLTRWAGYYTGAHRAMTHYAALFDRTGSGA